MKRKLTLFMFVIIMLMIAGCGSANKNEGTSQSKNSDSMHTSSTAEATQSQEAKADDSVEELSLNIAGVMPESVQMEDSYNLHNDTDWLIDRPDDSTIQRLKDAFVTSWNSGNWSMSSEKNAVGDETLQDVMIFKGKGDPFSEYYVLVNATIHLSERFLPDGTSYLSMKSAGSDDPLYDRYMFSAFDADSSFFIFDLKALYENYEDAIKDIKAYCGDPLVSILSAEDRADYIASVENNAGGNETYDNMLTLLKSGRFDDAQQLYYKATNLTHAQSQKCLVLLTKYELLFNEISPIQDLVEVSGTFSLDSYTLNSWRDEDSENENDLVIYVEYHCKTTHPTMGTQTYQDYKTIPVTIDVENKTFHSR